MLLEAVSFRPGMGHASQRLRQCHPAPRRMNTEAGDGARTHDPQLGKLMLYQLSYAREARILAVPRQTLST
jgi:hypothetical protein